MSFKDEVRDFARSVETDSQALFVNVATATHASIQLGSSITGAPGQPVDTGALRASWQLEFETKDAALISTDKIYAPPIEDGIGPHGPLTLRSRVGGFRSVALTIAGFPALVQDEAQKLGVSGSAT